MILAIESTCDETGAGVVKRGGDGVEVLANVKASSEELHTKYGGIVPEVAAREQIKVVLAVIEEAMKKAEVKKDQIEKVAVSFGPGLMGSLLIGVETAKSLAWVWEKELLAVNHMKGHVLANWIVDGDKWRAPLLPALAVVVSGGHSDLIWVEDLQKWEKLGGTVDDAAGECFDKSARALGLGYPGGPAIEKEADKVDSGGEFKLPRPMIDQDNLKISFSGLKTAVVRGVEKAGKLDSERRSQLAWEVNEAIVEVLIKKSEKVMKEKEPKTILLAGGVAANKRLRKEMGKLAEKWGVEFRVPNFKYCTDNAAMIGAAGALGVYTEGSWKQRPKVNLATTE